MLYFTVIGMGVQAFRATSVTYFLALDARRLSCPAQQWDHLPDDLVLAVLMMPPCPGWAAGPDRGWCPMSRLHASGRLVLALLLFTGSVALIDVARTM